MSAGFGTFIVSGDGSDQAAYCRTILGYRDVLSQSFVTGNGFTGQDANHPVSNALDYSYTTEYSPDMAVRPTSATLTFNAEQRSSYFMIISKNAQESELAVTVYGYDTSIGAEVELCSFGSLTDGVPKMVYYGDEFDNGFVNTLSIRVVLTYTSKPYIMSMMCGEAIVFPRTMSLGFQPAHLAPLDEVRQFDADEGLNLVGGRRLARGWQMQGVINYVKMSKVEEFWREYSDHVLDSKPLCILWNDKKPDQAVYGTQVPDRLTKPKYKTSQFSSIDFDIVGWA